MAKTSFEQIEQDEKKVIKELQKNSNQSIDNIAKKCRFSRQKVWRTIKRLEENNMIWGYTAIIDDIRLNRVVYLVLLKMKSMTKELVNIIMKRIIENQSAKYNIRLIDAFHVTGEFDWIIRFSSPDRKTASKYYDSIRSIYEDFLLEKPIIIDINFIIMTAGKKNPKIKKLYEFVP